MTDKQQLMSLRIDEAKDRDALRSLDQELLACSAAWAGRLRIKIGVRLAAMRPPKAVVTAGLGSAYGLTAPDGRWLHRYRLGEDAFRRLEKDVAAAAQRGALGGGWIPGLFVLWASEWFRRSYRGEGHEWEQLTRALGCTVDQNTLRSVTERGLRQWGREVRAGAHGRYFLATLAREGGFPVAAVEQGGRGWARDVLGAIVSPMLAQPASGVERARELAAKHRDRLPRIFQDEEFIELCADLAFALVELRRTADAPALAAGIPVAAWLEQNHPHWRDELPLAMGNSAAEALIGGLLAVEADTVTGATVGVERLLERAKDGSWREAATISLNGLIDGAVMRGIEARDGRLRAFAAGEFARVVPGELAMIEPPAQGETAWLARATKRSKGVLPVPFATAIELDLRSGEQRVARIALPSGKPRRGRLLVCTVIAADQDQPTRLKVEGSGSGAYRALEVVLQAPADWQVAAAGDERAEPIGNGAGDSRLWRVIGGALVTDPQGDCYRIRTGQARDRRDAIELMGGRPAWGTVAGDVDLFSGPPHVRTSDPSRGALFVRPIGSKEWRPAPRALPVGHYEIGWRENRLMLDRRRIAVLPPTASLTRRGLGRDTRFALSGWQDCSLIPLEGAPVVASQDGLAWTSRPISRPTHWFDAEISWPDAPPVRVRIEYPSEAAIARWDGTILRGGTRITLAELRDLVAVDAGAMRLFGELVDRRAGRAATTMTWSFDQEMPMSSVAADIESLLLPGSIDAEVKLGMLDGIETYWHVGQFAVRLSFDGGGLVASKGIVSPNAELCGRSFADAATEVSFGPYSLMMDANHRPVPLPARIGGGWLVYLREGSTVISRPLPVTGPGRAPEGMTALARAMTLLPSEGLDEALDLVLASAIRDDDIAAGVIKELNTLVASLDGLPPATLRVLELAAHRPAVLTRMAMYATAEEREAVLALSDALPFAWCLMPKSCWEEAQAFAFGQLLAKLANLESGPQFAKQALEMAVDALVQREPLLGPILRPQRGVMPLKDVAQVFLNRAVDRISGHGSRYRQSLDAHLPDYFLHLPDHCLETLDAPCAAALAVAEQWTPGSNDIRHIKTVARNFPTYFADAFAVSLLEYL